ncbi:bifunctional riboflavin kinase/FAD synthetase [Thermosipho atlanticus]|uniref:Riboflavin biosynthesis protein n=1 Tax=Thermosipho atlanticus DSM 15807 TaxID=1123380 RepID=A0A1M5SZR6_9BACT|nr:bifunctional riboflavin kinase/FAD synthetase [Thermosipho atlanticus]SHH43840.1 FMN adenylyltransferase [Thermosipho atlanticus DSM 15807]
MRVVTIGVFDGVHRGHVRILEELKNLAKKYHAASEIFTIIYPIEYYNGNFDGLLISLQERINLLEMYGTVYTLDLLKIKNISPAKFFNFISKDTKAIVVGEDFRFGKNAEGDISLLEKFCKDENIELKVIKDITVDGKRISSTLIRKLIKSGQIKKANYLLGRPFSIHGKVYKDKQIGRKLGFPTANIRHEKDLINPKNGVYLCRVYVPEVYYGLMNIGIRPTIEKTKTIKYEVYILDFSDDIYNNNIHVELLEFLREEKKFENITKLIAQMKNDVIIARKILEEQYEYRKNS